jgi:hypothetical protein
MQQPIARAPQFRSFSLNVLPQTVKNTAIELGIHGLALGDKFMVHNPSNVEKHDEHAFECGAPSLVLGILDSSIAKTGTLLFG